MVDLSSSLCTSHYQKVVVDSSLWPTPSLRKPPPWMFTAEIGRRLHQNQQLWQRPQNPHNARDSGDPQYPERQDWERQDSCAKGDVIRRRCLKNWWVWKSRWKWWLMMVNDDQSIYEYTTTGWWLTYTPEKYDRQLGWWHSQLNGKIKVMFQTTNQFC